MPDIDFYARQGLVPSWDNSKLRGKSIAILGSGGLGACIFQSAVLMGVGEEAVTLVVDKEDVEASNLSRIPFATPKDIGWSKVDVAAAWARRARPRRKVQPIKGSILDPEVQRQVAMADIIIGAVDSDLARYVLQHLASEFMRPLLDGGSGVRVDEINGQPVCLPSGQVRTFVPGSTACLSCTMGLDQVAINNEVARLVAAKSTETEEILRKSSYLAGSLAEQAPTPSVHHLNAIVANLLVQLLARYVIDGLPENANALVVELSTPSISIFTAESAEHCPFCGPSAIYGRGRTFSLDEYRKVEVPEASGLYGNMSTSTVESSLTESTFAGASGTEGRS